MILNISTENLNSALETLTKDVIRRNHRNFLTWFKQNLSLSIELGFENTDLG